MVLGELVEVDALVANRALAGCSRKGSAACRVRAYPEFLACCKNSVSELSADHCPDDGVGRFGCNDASYVDADGIDFVRYVWVVVEGKGVWCYLRARRG